jgi:hypothetical protein
MWTACEQQSSYEFSEAHLARNLEAKKHDTFNKWKYQGPKDGYETDTTAGADSEEDSDDQEDLQEEESEYEFVCTRPSWKDTSPDAKLQRQIYDSLHIDSQQRVRDSYMTRAYNTDRCQMRWRH